MSYTSISEAQTDVTRFVDTYAVASEAIQPALTTATQTEQQLGDFRASVSEVTSLFRSFRTELDETDSLDLILTSLDAKRRIEVWAWERETRKTAQDFMVQVVESDATARSLTGRSDRATYTTREGETLQSIAQSELGDFQEWTAILAANPDILPGVIPSGTTLVIPEKR